jgi:hypothetical protein
MSRKKGCHANLISPSTRQPQSGIAPAKIDWILHCSLVAFVLALILFPTGWGFAQSGAVGASDPGNAAKKANYMSIII